MIKLIHSRFLLSFVLQLKATMLLRISSTEASVKISNFGVKDDEPDMDLPVWAGVFTYRTIVGPLETCDGLYEGIATPDYSRAYPDRWQE